LKHTDIHGEIRSFSLVEENVLRMRPSQEISARAHTNTHTHKHTHTNTHTNTHTHLYNAKKMKPPKKGFPSTLIY